MFGYNNPYYGPEKMGLEIVAELNPAMSYEFDMVLVWKETKSGNLYWAADAGCSCPTPFEDYTSVELLNKFNYEDIKQAVKERYGPSEAEKRDFLRKVRDLND